MTHYAKQQSQQKLSAVGLSFSVYFQCMKFFSLFQMYESSQNFSFHIYIQIQIQLSFN